MFMCIYVYIYIYMSIYLSSDACIHTHNFLNVYISDASNYSAS